jgi:hypothetical protein
MLWFDASGRAVVITARSVVDGAYTVSETWGGSVDIAREQITVAVPNGPVLRAHRVWVADQEVDLAALVLDEAPPDLRGTPLDRVAFDVEQPSGYSLRSLRADGNAIADDASASLDLDAALTDRRGAAMVIDSRVTALLGQTAPRKNRSSRAISLSLVPQDLRPRP